MGRQGGQGGQNRQRLEWRDIEVDAARCFDRPVPYAGTVRQKDCVEFASLRESRQFDIVFKTDMSVRARPWVPPSSNVMSGGVQKRPQFHCLPTVAHHTLLAPLRGPNTLGSRRTQRASTYAQRWAPG